MISGSAHEDLRRAAEELVRAACIRLGQHPLPLTTVYSPRYSGPGTGRAEPTPVLDVLAAQSSLGQEWTLWASMRDLTMAIAEDPEASAVLLSDAASNPLPPDHHSQATEMIASKLVADYLSALNRPVAAWSEEAFQMVWAIFESSRNDRTGEIMSWAPLYQAHCIGDPATIVLDADTTIVEPTPQERARLSIGWRQVTIGLAPQLRRSAVTG
jgi:hypothetical protein